MTLYNSSVIYSRTCHIATLRNPTKSRKARKIAACLNEFAESVGSAQVEGFIYHGSDPVAEDTLKHEAEKYVQEKLYGNLLAPIIWWMVRPLVMSVIQAWIESMLFSAEG